MAASNTDDFDGYRKWLGIINQRRLPTHYELLAISLDEDDPDVIQAAAQQRRHFVESKRGEGHDDLVTEILYRIDEAESTLLNTALRRDYDRKMDLFEKRRKNRQVDPVTRQSGRYRGGRAVGEDGGIVKTFAGIVAIVCVAFGGMVWFGSRVQPKPVDQQQVAPVAPAPAQVAQQPVAVITQPQQQVTAERKNLLKGINVKEDTFAGSWTFDGGTLVTADNSACNVFLPLPDNESYRLEIEATRTHGNAGLFVNISSFGSFSAVCIDRGVPHKNPLPNTQYSGLANIDGRDAAENPSKTLGTAFQTGKTATIIIEVRPRHISATVDGRSVVNWRGALSRLSGGKPKETGLGTWTSEGRTWRFSKIVLSKLNDLETQPPEDATATAMKGELMAFEGHHEPVWSVAFSPDGNRVLSGSGKKNGEYSIRLWESESGKEIQQFLGHTDTVRTVAFSPDGARIVSGSWDKTIRLWDLTTGKTIQVLQGHTDAITGGITFSSDGTRIFSGSIDGTARMWDVETGNELKSFEAKHEIHCIALSPDGLQLLTGGLRKWDDGDQKKAEAVLILWDITTGQQIRRFSGGTSMNTVCFSPDGKQILSAGPNWTMRLWDVGSGSELKTFEGHAGCFTPNGKHAFADRKDESLTLWNLETGAEVVRFKGHRAICVAISKEGRRALSGGFDNTVRVWGLPSNDELPTPNVSTPPDDKGIRVVINLAKSGEAKIRVGRKGEIPLASTTGDPVSLSKFPNATVHKTDNIHSIAWEFNNVNDVSELKSEGVRLDKRKGILVVNADRVRLSQGFELPIEISFDVQEMPVDGWLELQMNRKSPNGIIGHTDFWLKSVDGLKSQMKLAVKWDIKGESLTQLFGEKEIPIHKVEENRFTLDKSEVTDGNRFSFVLAVVGKTMQGQILPPISLSRLSLRGALQD